MNDRKPSSIYEELPTIAGQGENIFTECQFNIDKFKEFESKLIELDNHDLRNSYDYFNRLRLEERKQQTRSVDTEVIYEYVSVLLSVRAKRCNWLPDSRGTIQSYSRMFPDLNSVALEQCFSQSGVLLR